MFSFLLRLLVWFGFIQPPRLVARFSESHPSLSSLAERDLVVVRSGSFTKWVCLRCPCGCGEKIALSLDKKRRPSWSVVVDWLGRPTVAPSVWQTKGCYSHFWIRKGAVEWCAGTGQPYSTRDHQHDADRI